MIIDMHLHVEDVASLGWTMSAGDCVCTTDAAGVDGAVVMTLTDLPGLDPRGLERARVALAHFDDTERGLVLGGDAERIVRIGVPS